MYCWILIEDNWGGHSKNLYVLPIEYVFETCRFRVTYEYVPEVKKSHPLRWGLQLPYKKKRIANKRSWRWKSKTEPENLEREKVLQTP